MPRDEGFAVADVSTAKHTDPKFREMWRRLGDEAAMNAAAVLYEAVQLASWQQGLRVSYLQAAPFWMTDVRTPAAALKRAGLLDKSGCIPQHAWDSWYLPAYERREQRREAGRIGGQRSGRQRRSEGEAPLEQRSSAASAPLNPSVPSYPSVPSGPIRPSSPSTPAPAKKNGSKDQETDEERLARYRLLRDDTSRSADIRRAADDEVKRLEANHVH